jgi:hypothetical protein
MSDHKRCPVGHTCPAIDSALASLDNAQGLITDAMKELELLRKENEELRSWGNDEAENHDYYKDAFNQSDDELSRVKAQL